MRSAPSPPRRDRASLPAAASPRQQRRQTLIAFTGLLAVLAVIATALTAASQGWSIVPSQNRTIFLLFIAGLIVSEVRLPQVRFDRGLATTFAWILSLSLALCAAPTAALIAIALGTVAGELMSRRSIEAAILLAAQLTLSVASAVAVLLATGQTDALSPGGTLSWIWLPAVVLAGLIAVVVRGALAGAAHSIGTGDPAWASMTQHCQTTLATDGLLLTLAPVSVVVAQRSLLLLPILYITAFAVYRAAHVAADREYDANHDTLTGLPNRRHFQTEVQTALAAGRTGAVVLLDLDGFKDVNDHLGHQAGDAVLTTVADRLRDSLRTDDVVARLGGDEFVLFLAGPLTPDQVLELLNSLGTTIRSPAHIEGALLEIGVSLGAALAPDHGDDIDVLLERADSAMYLAKRGKLGVSLFDPGSNLDNQGRLSMVNSLQRAVDKRELVLHFQPWVDIVNGRVLGIEALVRWPHPERGLLNPGEFLPLVRDPELAQALNHLLLEMAIGQCAQWQKAGFIVPVSVNMHSITLETPHFFDVLASMVRSHRMSPGLVQIELDDREVTGANLAQSKVLRELHRMGVNITLDDFGAGTASLASLRAAPISTVKLSRSLTANKFGNASAAVIRNLTQLSRDLGIDLVAKGVEELDSARALADNGCSSLQGHLVARPMPIAELMHWLANSRFDAGPPEQEPEPEVPQLAGAPSPEGADVPAAPVEPAPEGPSAPVAPGAG